MLKPSGITKELPCYDIDALDTALLALSTGDVLALSDGHGADASGDLTWMLPKVIPLTRISNKPFVTLSLEFKLLDYNKGRSWINIIIEGSCGTLGEMRLNFGSAPTSNSRANLKGWLLHLVTHHQVASAPESPQAPAELASEPEDAENSVKRKRDDIFRKMFG